MLVEVFSFDPKLDLQEVDQFGFIDLAVAYNTGIVEGSADLDQSNFNEIDDPMNVGGKPSDIFDAMRAASAIRAAGKSVEQTNGVTVVTATK